MNPETRTPEEIYERIMAAAKHPKSTKALANIKWACDELEDRYKIPITVTRVGDQTKDKEGGPTAPSLRNNKEFVAYVKARAIRQILPEAERKSPTGTYRSNDPEANAIIYMLEAKCKATERKLRCITTSLGHSPDFDLSEFLKQSKLTLASLQPGQPPPPAPSSINSKVFEIIAKLLDPKHMEPFGLINHKGSIISPERNNRVMLHRSEVEILRTELERQRQEEASGQGDHC